MTESLRKSHADYGSDDIGQISKTHIVSSSGVSYRDFRKSLQPRFMQVWVELLCGHVALVSMFFLLQWFEVRYPGLWPLEVFLGAIIVGYIAAYIQLFFHEASHFNLARSRVWSDRLANIFISPLTGLDIAQYRKIHFDHHRHLGTTEDPERSYFRALNLRFMLEALSGEQVLALILKRSQPGQVAQYDLSAFRGRFQLLLGLGLQSAIVLALLVYGNYASAVAWVAGMLLFFPFFTALRQVLEHRSEMADASVDYALVPHGETNRLFGDGPLASTLGGAGFNRHFLHHWDPQLSYTRLKDLEEYLKDTPLASTIMSVETTYADTFLRLFDPRWY